MSRDYVLQSFRPPVALQIDYARELNPQQLAAVTALPGPALVIAGAGAGKTRTLTYRVAYLLEQGVRPENILLLTFTNKAAREMMRRVNDLLAHDTAALWGGTFHSIGNRILRRHADLLGYARDFTILDREDAEDLLRACVDEAEIELKAAHLPKTDVLGEIFSLAANMRQSIGLIIGQQFGFALPVAAAIEDLARRYTERKRAARVVDFDDLLALWFRLLEEQADVRDHYQRRFQFILVDEYQDTNQLQSDLIDLLAARHHNVMAVGDDAQSIYSWRGANFLNIFKFPDRYPETRIFKIETNYRSSPEILAVANAAIAPNVEQYPKVLAAARAGGAKPALVACGDARVQATFVAQRVLELREQGASLSDMAVLYRSHFHTLELQMELTRRQIPFAITSGIRFFEQAHLKDVTAYLKLRYNPRNELAFKRLVKMLPGIGPKAAEKLWAAFNAKLDDSVATSADAAAVGGQVSVATGPAGSAPVGDPGSLSASPSSPSDGLELQPPASSLQPPLAPALRAIANQLPKKAVAAWPQFVATIAQVEDESVRDQPAAMIRLILDATYEDYLQETFANYRARLEDVEQLAIFARDFANLEEFLSQLALLTNLEAEGDAAARTDEERLRLSTIHQAKGLEFGVVFVIMLCEGMFPSHRSTARPKDVEEERRLFYVAITRAKHELYLSYPLIRATHTSGSDLMQQRSRFLDDLPSELLDQWNLVQPFDPYRTSDPW